MEDYLREIIANGRVILNKFSNSRVVRCGFDSSCQKGRGYAGPYDYSDDIQIKCERTISEKELKY